IRSKELDFVQRNKDSRKLRTGLEAHPTAPLPSLAVSQLRWRPFNTWHFIVAAGFDEQLHESAAGGHEAHDRLRRVVGGVPGNDDAVCVFPKTDDTEYLVALHGSSPHFRLAGPHQSHDYWPAPGNRRSGKARSGFYR